MQNIYCSMCLIGRQPTQTLTKNNIKNIMKINGKKVSECTRAYVCVSSIWMVHIAKHVTNWSDFSLIYSFTSDFWLNWNSSFISDRSQTNVFLLLFCFRLALFLFPPMFNGGHFFFKMPIERPVTNIRNIHILTFLTDSQLSIVRRWKSMHKHFQLVWDAFRWIVAFESYEVFAYTIRIFLALAI